MDRLGVEAGDDDPVGNIVAMDVAGAAEHDRYGAGRAAASRSPVRSRS